MHKLSVIIPIYNEFSSAQEFFSRILSKKIDGIEIEWIVVESNSTDGTKEFVKALEETSKITTIWQDEPKGKGYAVRMGLAEATGDIILIQDADLEYSIEDYEKLLAPILKNKADFVLGTRHTPGSLAMRKFGTDNHYAVLFNLAHWGFTALLNASLGLKMTDPFTMYKVFRKSCLGKIILECDRFDLDWELVIKLVRAGYKPLEVPVYYRSRDYTEGKKVSIWKDPPLWLKAWWKYAILKK